MKHTLVHKILLITLVTGFYALCTPCTTQCAQAVKDKQEELQGTTVSLHNRIFGKDNILTSRITPKDGNDWLTLLENIKINLPANNQILSKAFDYSLLASIELFNRVRLAYNSAITPALSDKTVKETGIDKLDTNKINITAIDISFIEQALAPLKTISKNFEPIISSLQTLEKSSPPASTLKLAARTLYILGATIQATIEKAFKDLGRIKDLIKQQKTELARTTALFQEQTRFGEQATGLMTAFIQITRVGPFKQSNIVVSPVSRDFIVGLIKLFRFMHFFVQEYNPSVDSELSNIQSLFVQTLGVIRQIHRQYIDPLLTRENGQLKLTGTLKSEDINAINVLLQQKLRPIQKEARALEQSLYAQLEQARKANVSRIFNSSKAQRSKEAISLVYTLAIEVTSALEKIFRDFNALRVLVNTRQQAPLAELIIRQHEGYQPTEQQPIENE